MIIIYTRLKDLRDDNDLTQDECAKIGYISKKSYIRYEKGEREIPTDVMIRYALYYDVSLDYLVGLTSDPQKKWKKDK